MIQQYSRELTPAAEKEIWKRIGRGEGSGELLQIAMDDGLSILDAERIVGEMRMANQLVGNARKEPLSVRLGLVYGPPMAIGGVVLTVLLLSTELRLPLFLWISILVLSLYATIFGAVSTRRAWAGR